MANKGITFGRQTFSETREDLISMVKEYYPEVLSDFTDASVGSLLLDLNAGVSNNLFVTLDRKFQETNIDNAQQLQNVLNIAKTWGFKMPGKRASVTVVDFSVDVPVKGDGPDEDYYPILMPNSQVVGGGKIFETSDIIDWSIDVSNLGDKNRSIIPNFDSNGIIKNYTITKREVVFNGRTNIFKKVITDQEVKPFFEIVLPDQDVIEIESVILIPGVTLGSTPTDADFNDEDYKYYEVDALVQNKVFVDDINGGTNSATTGSTGIKAAKWLEVTKKFLVEFSYEGYCKLIFGGGNGELDAFKTGMIKAGVNNQNFLNTYLNNTSLGEMLKKNHTLFIKYRTGGGVNSNVGANTLTQLGQVNLSVNGIRTDINRIVNKSLRVNNPIPAIGGNDGLTVDQVRFLTKYNYAAQARSLTVNDYVAQAYKMPGRYGAPFKLNGFKENNKIVIPILGLDENGKLSNTSNSLLKENLSEYLVGNRMSNDYVEIRDGKIYDLAFEIDLFIDNVNKSQLANSVIQTVIEYFDIRSLLMNEDIMLTDLEENINNVAGVVNILSLKVFNKVGGNYSVNEIEQEYLDDSTREIKLINNTLYSSESSMFNIRYPEKDIVVYLRRKNDLSI